MIVEWDWREFRAFALLAKKALLRKLSDSHPDPELAALEKEC